MYVQGSWMISKQLQNNSQDIKMNELKQILLTNQPTLNLDSHQSILNHTLRLITQKDHIINSLEAQLIKYKSETLKLNKTIQNLQEKVNALSPNTNNTGSKFMMASQFKDHFDEFMKNVLPTALSPLVQYPSAYVKYASQYLLQCYNKMSETINTKIKSVCSEILNIDPETDNNFNKTKSSLLKILQDNWQFVFRSCFQEKNQENAFKLSYENDEIREIQQSEEFLEMSQSLRKICAYMILQERPWKFMLKIGEKNVQKFAKKEHVCIDGWIREGETVLMVLEGISREGEQGSQEISHPNLKNYSIPYQQEDQQDYTFIPLLKQQEVIQKQTTKIEQGSQYENILLISEFKSVRNGKNVLISSQNLTESLVINNENCCPNKILKSELDKQNSTATFVDLSPIEIQHNQEQPEQNSGMNSPSIPLKPIYLNNSDINVSTTRNNSKRQKNTKMTLSTKMAPPTSKNTKDKSKHGLITDPSFEQILTFPKNRSQHTNSTNKRKNIDQLPLKRQSSKIKKNSANSRKGSAGKIVGQQIAQSKTEHSKNQKENRNANLSKQVIYKDIIKQKLCENMNAHKSQRTNKQSHKQNCFQKEKNKEQDRPLRVMHMKKMRDKYLNL